MMMPKTIILLAAATIMTGSFLLSQILNFIDWLKKKESEEEE